MYLRQLHGRLGDVVYEMTRVQFSQFSPPRRWAPALNVYRGDRCIVVCADLAGVSKDSIHLEAQPRRLHIRGRRETPEPGREICNANQVLAMEIDYGEFEREVLFPVDVDVDRVTAEQKNGLLWIYLPLETNA
ncbi:MAG TPA: Hsp20/alpha crystallin family protein [Verrucomicrobia bacterium]|nr:Hsp20/alpha crystallin family protein [Verrucomicrobiota bacterium]HOB33513.1 Hsp20/alpha crystallin family protein [Verrucomicrobiota bacterium]HOP96344.1 Hsp20/alpha crystallin family protein [Verrucomicrobiota bacterium]